MTEHETDVERNMQCRFCFSKEGPGGLADLLIQPCSCAGSVAHAHVSCLYRWQLTKAEQLRDWGTCEVCQETYQVPKEAVQALIAQGCFQQIHWTTRVKHAVSKLIGAGARLLPIVYQLETVMAALGAADYGIQAYAMVPTMLSDPRGCLRQYGWEYGWKFTLTLVSLLCYPVLAALRVEEDQAQRRLLRTSRLLHWFYYASLFAASQVGHAVYLRAQTHKAGLTQEVRELRLRALEVTEMMVMLSFPLAASFVGGCVAWWRFWLCWATPKSFYVGTLQAASHRVCVFAVDDLRCGEVAEAAVQLAGWVYSTAQEWGCRLGNFLSSITLRVLLNVHRWGGAMPADGGKPAVVLHESFWVKMLKFMDAQGGIDLAGVFSA